MAREMGSDWDSEHPGWQARFVEYFSSVQNAGQAQVFCASQSGQVVGMAAVVILDDYHAHARGRKSGRINMVYVMPNCRRRGMARKMMESALDWLKAHHCEVARLNSSPEGRPLYESLGFKPRDEMEYFL
jgi:ribosomal protein S18 acetylase RimI-like enzyme